MWLRVLRVMYCVMLYVLFFVCSCVMCVCLCVWCFRVFDVWLRGLSVIYNVEVCGVCLFVFMCELFRCVMRLCVLCLMYCVMLHGVFSVLREFVYVFGWSVLGWNVFVCLDCDV